MFYFYVVLLACSFFRGVRGCIRIITSYKYIKSDNGYAKKQGRQKIKFHILIPVLREQEIIEDTIHHFASLNGNYKVYFITTEKESTQKASDDKIPKKYRSLPVTKEVAEKYLHSHPKEAEKVKLIHSPNIEGGVAHQYNYALNQLKKTAKPDDYILVYNADSRVKKDVLLKYERVINSNSYSKVIQQSAAFLLNYKQLTPFLKSVAMLQTRWTLAHEIPRILTTHGTWGFTEGAHVVSHGLCVRYDFLQKIGGFPQDCLDEDLPLGYFIRLHGARIYLLNDLENAETPNSVKNMFNQYRSWFYALLYYPSYIAKALKNPSLNHKLAILWGMKYTIRGILWLGLSLAWILLFILPFYLGKPILLLYSLISFTIYAPLSYLLVYKTVGKDFGIKTELLPILLTPAAFMTHSYGPLMATFDFIKSTIFKTSIYRNKTER